MMARLSQCLIEIQTVFTNGTLLLKCNYTKRTELYIRLSQTAMVPPISSIFKEIYGKRIGGALLANDACRDDTRKEKTIGSVDDIRPKSIYLNYKQQSQYLTNIAE